MLNVYDHFVLPNQIGNDIDDNPLGAAYTVVTSDGRIPQPSQTLRESWKDWDRHRGQI